MENVDALVSKKFIGYFQKWVDFLTGQGYASFSAVLNAKDYGVPQSRKRVFCVSIRDFDGEFHFPKPIGCERRLRDVLESDVDERYYLRDEVVENFLRNNARQKEKGNGFRFEPRTDGVSNTLTSVSKDNYLLEPRIDNLGSYKPNGYNGSCVIGEGGIAPTVRENHGEVTAVMHPKYRIRKLTPRECFRLMDVDDADIDKIQGAGICNSQQYKLAGNSIVVNVLYHIFRKMFVEQGNEEQQLKLF